MEIQFFKIYKKIRFYGALILQSGLVSLFLLACSQARTPEGVLSKDQMVRIFSDVYITEEKVNKVNLPPDSAKKVMVFLKNRILENNQVDDSVFEMSFNYYVDHPKEMELIYSALVDSLQLQEERSRKP